MAIFRLSEGLNMPAARKNNRIYAHNDGDYMSIIHSGLREPDRKGEFTLDGRFKLIGPCQSAVNSPLLFGRIAENGLILGRYGGVESVVFDMIFDLYRNQYSGEVGLTEIECLVRLDTCGTVWEACHYASFRSAEAISAWIRSNRKRALALMEFDFRKLSQNNNEFDEKEIADLESSLSRWKKKCADISCYCESLCK
jgi:hypothetical protein